MVKIVITLTTLATTYDALQNADLIRIDYRTSLIFNDSIEVFENHEEGTDDIEAEIDNKVSQTCLIVIVESSQGTITIEGKSIWTSLKDFRTILTI